MVPNEITRQHILAVMREIDRNGVPAGREGKRFQLLYKGKRYPPKYVISLASKYATGQKLSPSEFSGGQESNGFLAALGFNVVADRPSDTATPRLSAKRDKPFVSTIKRHDERCPGCKATVGALLKKLYGKVEMNYKFEAGTRPEDFIGTPCYQDLEEIFESLETNRGFTQFVKAQTLPNCDFFVPDPGFIVEFDESQHLTACRELTLRKYPAQLSLGFDRNRWMHLCRELCKQDNDPPYRDEQRAWYDTLRDFLPAVKGLKPTVRLYSRETQWCALDPERSADVAKFKQLVENKKPSNWVATVIVESRGASCNEERLVGLRQILDQIGERTVGEGVILFPGGWFSAGEEEAKQLYAWVEENLRETLGNKETDVVVVLGVDGRVAHYGSDHIAKDQIAIAISKEGTRALGRKFHPAPKEIGRVELAQDYRTEEENRSRVLDFNGRKYFLCACYDSFGIKQMAIPNFGIDVVLDLVHGFRQKGEGGSGDVYFAKHGFAGTSKHWNCLTLGAAVFFDREIPHNWPSAVFWNQGTKSTKRWCYSDNPVGPKVIFELPIREGLASIRIFDITEVENLIRRAR